MTQFEQIGINRQLSARNAKEAKREFMHSCDICCKTGRHIECDRCHISFTNALMCAYFNDTNSEKQKGN